MAAAGHSLTASGDSSRDQRWNESRRFIRRAGKLLFMGLHTLMSRRLLRVTVCLMTSKIARADLSIASDE